MIQKEHLEQFYDYCDSVAELLYEKYKVPYIDGMNEAFNYLLDDTLEEEYEKDDIEEIRVLKAEIKDISFTREEVRKGIQLGLLKGYKHVYESNAVMTPDTIGIFIGYLLQKLYKDQEIHTVLDPLIGTGNLVYSALNQLDDNPRVIGVDNDYQSATLARNIGDLLEYENQVYCQDTLQYYGTEYNLLLVDLPIVEEKVPYLPYQILNHHVQELEPGGYTVALIENDFFDQEQAGIFKQQIDEVAHIVGLIKLSDTLFHSNPKSILILQRIGENTTKPKHFLLADMPSFEDKEAMNQTIIKIEQWFEKRKDDEDESNRS